MIREFQAFFTLFKQGKELANAKTWKDRHILTGALFGVLASAVTIACGFGYVIPVDEHLLLEVSNGIGALFAFGSAIVTVVTSAKVGVKDKSKGEDK